MTFTPEELEIIATALVDSGSMRSDYNWYLKCAEIHTKIVTAKRSEKRPA